MDTQLFDSFNNRYIIRGKLTTLTGLHIGGSQGKIEPAATDSTVVKDIYGRPYIPGSSLKGVMRAFTERIIKPVFNSCACNIFDKDNSCSAKINRLRQSNSKDLSPEKIYEKLCDVCRIYGNQSFAGRLMFSDAILLADSWDPSLYDIRDGVGIDRDSNTAFDRAKYDYEVVPAGTEFRFEAIAENMDQKSWKYVVTTLIAMAHGDITVGGLSTRGLGRIKLEDVVITKIKANDLIDYLIKGQPGQEISLEQEAKEVFKDDVQRA